MAKSEQKITFDLYPEVNGQNTAPVTVTVYGEKVGDSVNQIVGKCGNPLYKITSVTPFIEPVRNIR